MWMWGRVWGKEERGVGGCPKAGIYETRKEGRMGREGGKEGRREGGKDREEIQAFPAARLQGLNVGGPGRIIAENNSSVHSLGDLVTGANRRRKKGKRKERKNTDMGWGGERRKEERGWGGEGR